MSEMGEKMSVFNSQMSQKIRSDFPILKEEVNGYPLIYVDNAATTQKPNAVIDAISHYYRTYNANVHRGVHSLSVRASLAYDDAREKVGTFIGAKEASECVFVRGATEAINLVASSFLSPKLQKDDEILITHLEHHANIVPWKMLCEKTGAKLVVVPISQSGEILFDDFKKCITSRTRFAAFQHVSNALGTILPIEEMIPLLKAQNIPVLIDGAQALAHLPVDVQKLGCDFYVFSAHKMYGPTGIGVLWGRKELLESMPPWQGGGDMIREVTFEKITYAPPPIRFEAGTPHIAGVIGLGAAIDYLQALDMAAIHVHEEALLSSMIDAFKELRGYRLIGTAQKKTPIISFVHEKIHAHDIGTVLDSYGIATRSGHHCAMPLMNFYKVPATTRISFSFYNTLEEVQKIKEALSHVEEIFL